jgi:hypothetical protein
MFFGAKMPLLKEAGSALRKYHGYYFSWAILYTFWYHPMEITGGHLLGFLYMFLLMLQGSLFFTRMHVNPRWTIFSEASVVLHGVIVAILAGQEWPRFFGGFLGLFVITQMHGLGFSKTVRWIIGGLYIAALFVVYSYTQGIEYIYEAGLIPMTEFVLVVLLSLIVVGLCRLLGYRATPSTK